MNKSKGFTLIELIVSITLFTIIMFGIAVFYASNSSRVSRSERAARMEVAGQRAYESFKSDLMERVYVNQKFSRLVFDSIWQDYEVNDVVFALTDTINGMIYDTDIVIDSFEFDTTKAEVKDSARTCDTGSRIWMVIKTKNLNFGDSTRTVTVFSHHR